jgi:ribosomal protein S18 acetylase RimI-like enzyme
MGTVAAGPGTPPPVVLRPLTLAAYAALESRGGEWRPEEIAAEATAADRFFQGLDAAGQHVGCVWVVPLPERWWPYVTDPAAAAYLKQLTVATARRGRGYGRAVLAATEARLAAAGVAELCLDVSHTNTVARRLYTSAGFDVVYELATKAGRRKRLPGAGA